MAICKASRTCVIRNDERKPCIVNDGVLLCCDRAASRTRNVKLMNNGVLRTLIEAVEPALRRKLPNQSHELDGIRICNINVF